MRELFKQNGYWRIEKPLFSYDTLNWIAAGALGLIAIVLLGVWRISISRVRLPMSITLLKLAICISISPAGKSQAELV